MLKRLRWMSLGYVLGLATSLAVQARLRRAVTRYAPPEVRDRLAASLQGLRDDARAAWSEGRTAMHARERELRRDLDLDTRAG